MNANLLAAAALMVLAGTFLATQGAVNAALARNAGGLAAAAISFGVGFAVLAGATFLATPLPRPGALANVPWWAWTGGLLGAFFVWATIWSVPRVGVLTVAAALVLGQMLAALVIDRLGLFGVPVQPASWARLAGAALVGCGLVLSRL